MGWLALSYQFNWEEAAKEFRRAIELAPSNFIGYNGLSFALQAGGRLDEALAASESPRETQILASCLPDSMPNWAMRLRRENSWSRQWRSATRRLCHRVLLPSFTPISANMTKRLIGLM